MRQLQKKNKINFKYNFENKVVLITGASKGIGFEVSKSFLKHGSNLVICSSNSKRIKESFKKLVKLKKKNQMLFYLKIDISSENQVKKLVNFTLKKFKKIDVLINNAGIYGPKGLIENVNWGDWIKTIRVNLFGSVLLCKEVIPHFKKLNRGKIIQLSGGGAASPLPRISGYAVSKAGITRFVENLSEELKDYNIDINAVAPGAINTNMLDEVLRASPKKIGTYYYKKALKQKKLGGSSYKSCTDLILFLASNYSNGIKGKLISALWDDWANFPKYRNKLYNSDLFTLRRVTSKDRGINWGHSKSKSIYDRSLVPSMRYKKKL